MGSLSEEQDPGLLDAIFGQTSTGGNTAEERARASTRKFVRSQVQLALATPKAAGRVLTAHEALETFGLDALRTVIEEGPFPLVTSTREPAATLLSRRTELNLPRDSIARTVGVSPAELVEVESGGKVAPIRLLERFAQALALDERVLGYQPNARADTALGVRLRELTTAKDSAQFSAASVLALAEAAWVIARQDSLSRDLGVCIDISKEFGVRSDSNYTYPTWSQGYRLAQRTRRLLGIGDDTPIESLRLLIEETLGIPLVQQALDERFAGATLSSGSVRGIVVNERGRNNNVWLRRMTLCHELGHLLWDPDQRLNKLVVDEYDGITGNYLSYGDVVEIRANAFAISLLAPPISVHALATEIQDAGELLATVMERYGISATAAKWHITNVAGIDTHHVSIKELPSPSDEWIARENLTIDFFPIADTPISRRGRFASLVARALETNIISQDTASMYLQAPAGEVGAKLTLIRDLYS